MSGPTQADWERLVRWGHDLKGNPRMLTWYAPQGDATTFETHMDTDWAGCRRTRRSTTGGFSAIGRHLIKMWCLTQAVVALGSAEALQQGRWGSSLVLGSWACRFQEGFWATPARPQASVQRQGLGKLRHIDTHYFWIQDTAARCGRRSSGKLARSNKSADALHP